MICTEELYTLINPTPQALNPEPETLNRNFPLPFRHSWVTSYICFYRLLIKPKKE